MFVVILPSNKKYSYDVYHFTKCYYNMLEFVLVKGDLDCVLFCILEDPYFEVY